MQASIRVRHQLASLWPDRALSRSQDALSTIRSRKRLLANEAANRFEYPVVARFESRAPSATIKNFHLRPRDVGRTTRPCAQSKSGLAAWQQIVIAAYIQKHVAESITIPALARFVYLSSHRFSCAFKQSFGISAHRYVVQQRVERGKALLIDSRWSIAEIALALGFKRSSSFSAAFRKITGISPIEYRLSQQ